MRPCYYHTVLPLVISNCQARQLAFTSSPGKIESPSFFWRVQVLPNIPQLVAKLIFRKVKTHINCCRLVESVFCTVKVQLVYLYNSDFNECQSFSHDCPENSTCVNNNGSYTCQCSPGYGHEGQNCTGLNNFTFSYIIFYISFQSLEWIFIVLMDLINNHYRTILAALLIYCKILFAITWITINKHLMHKWNSLFLFWHILLWFLLQM